MNLVVLCVDDCGGSLLKKIVFCANISGEKFFSVLLKLESRRTHMQKIKAGQRCQSSGSWMITTNVKIVTVVCDETWRKTTSVIGASAVR